MYTGEYINKNSAVAKFIKQILNNEEIHIYGMEIQIKRFSFCRRFS